MQRDELLEMIHALCWALHHLPEGGISHAEADAVLLEGVRLMRREGREFEPLDRAVAEFCDSEVPVDYQFKPVPLERTGCSLVGGSTGRAEGVAG